MSPWWETRSSHFSFNRDVSLPACWNPTNGPSLLTSEAAIVCQPARCVPGLTPGNCPAVVAFLWAERQRLKLGNLCLYSGWCPLSEKLFFQQSSFQKKIKNNNSIQIRLSLFRPRALKVKLFKSGGLLGHHTVPWSPMDSVWNVSCC